MSDNGNVQFLFWLRGKMKPRIQLISTFFTFLCVMPACLFYQSGQFKDAAQNARRHQMREKAQKRLKLRIEGPQAKRENAKKKKKKKEIASDYISSDQIC
ncbi:hypothetical protein QN277_017663 [Acacia crassicarpa]|uniref:Transmembrane protein n=1 Tax=Acacia crassicarpa TaxID=499986 RepID=A0AAE1MNG1_9FABA|nr:hypothetical protein QN277_017663 [Acacia crassicarpa]